MGIDPPPISPQWIAAVMARWPVRPFINHALGEILDAMRYHIAYLGSHGQTFDTTRAEALLEPLDIKCPEFAEYGETLFSYLKVTSWGKRPLSYNGSQRCLQSI